VSDAVGVFLNTATTAYDPPLNGVVKVAVIVVAVDVALEARMPPIVTDHTP
jgi:hypothetical protein